MKSVPQLSATAVNRRIPHPRFGVDVNFCRNAQCSQVGVQPDWRDGRGQNLSSNADDLQRGEVNGSGDKKAFTCGSCGQKSVIENNRAIVEEDGCLRHLQRHDGSGKSCAKAVCLSNRKTADDRPDLYRKSGRTSAGRQALPASDVARPLPSGIPREPIAVSRKTVRS